MRRNQHLPRSAKSSVQPYADADEILRNRTCLSERDKPSSVTRRFEGSQLLNEQHRNTSSSTSSTSRQVECYAYAAAECYEQCISVYLNDLSAFDRRVERERQSILSHIDHSIPLKLRQVFDDSSLAKQIERIKISFEAAQSTVELKCARQSFHIPRLCRQTMSSNDSNNNRDEDTKQVNQPPEIVLSDHSTNQNIIKGDSAKSCYSDSEQAIDKNCYLSVPIRHCYSSEARPP